MIQSMAGSIGNVPMMGWTSQYFSSSLDERFIREQAKVLIDSGMAECGYRYVIIHEGWYGGEDESGVLKADYKKFSDMATLIKDLNMMGLKAGLFITAGQISGKALQGNCRRILLEWGFDFISIGELQGEGNTRAICQCIRSTGKDVLIDLRTNGFPDAWVAEIANQWNYYDVMDQDFYNVTRHQMDNCREEDNDETKSATRIRAKYAGPGHFLQRRRHANRYWYGFFPGSGDFLRLLYFNLPVDHRH